MRIFLFFTLLFHASISFSQKSSFSSLESFVDLINLKATEVDSILRSKGFVNSEVNGLMVIYLKNNERLTFLSNPRELLLQSTSMDMYLKISNLVADNYRLANANDSAVVDNKSYKTSTFENENYRISFFTQYNSAKKVNLYFIRIAKNSLNTSAVDKNSMPKAQNSSVQPNEDADELIKRNQKIKENILNIPFIKSKNDTLKEIKPSNGLADGGIPCKKYKYTGGIGLYGYVHTPGPGWNGNVYTKPEMLVAWNLGVEISKQDYMTRKGKNFTNTRIDINATSFADMQRYYSDGITEKYQTIFLTKSYFTIGLISELRRKNESFLMSFCPGLNWTTGKLDDAGREGFVTGTIQMGEYYQHNFRSKKKSKEMFSFRLGFEQFFSVKGGYIGQFAMTFGL